MKWIIGAVYEIRYSDGNERTIREIIRVSEIITVQSEDKDVYIRAFCYVRNRERKFHEARIVDAMLIARQEEKGSKTLSQREATSKAPLKRHSKKKVESFTAARAVQEKPADASGYAPLPRSVGAAPQPDRFAPLFHDTNQEDSCTGDSQVAVSMLDGLPFSIQNVKSKKTPIVSPYASDYFTTNTSATYRDYTVSKKYAGKILRFLGIVLVLGLALLWMRGALSSSPVKTNSVSNASAVTVPQPVLPALEEIKLGGLILRIHRDSKGTWYEVPARGYIGFNKHEAILKIRVPNFVNYTGIKDTRLIAKYFSADTDGNGKLSYAELEQFAKTMRNYVSYKNNETALRPDIFLAQGGGDCEDFALYIAGLLRFWGWQPYIACFNPPRGNGHAVCFSYEGTGGFPKHYTYYTLEGKTSWDGTALPNGKYIPIDFDHVGSLSNAVGEGWELGEIFIPEKIWGMKL